MKAIEHVEKSLNITTRLSKPPLYTVQSADTDTDNFEE